MSYKDEDTLRELYCEQGKTMSEIADRFDCSITTIRNWMIEYGIDRRGDYGSGYVTENQGYMRYEVYHNNEREQVYVHRLVAVAKFGFDAVSGMDVHHRNGCELDNRRENIELATAEDHGRYHANQRWGNLAEDESAPS